MTEEDAKEIIFLARFKLKAFLWVSV